MIFLSFLNVTRQVAKQKGYVKIYYTITVFRIQGVLFGITEYRPDILLGWSGRLFLFFHQLHRLHNRSVYPDGSSMGSPAISLAWFISTWAYFFAFSGSLARAASRAVKAGWS